MEQNTDSSLFELQVDSTVQSYLGETARWAKFLAIMGFIGCGICALIGIFAGSVIGASMNAFGGRSGMGGLVTAIYLAMAVLLFLPCLYTYNFGSRMQVAIRSNDQEQLTQSFRNLKSHYKYMGILTIVYLGLLVLLMVAGIFGGFRG